MNRLINFVIFAIGYIVALAFLFFLLVLSGCRTTYNVKRFDIEFKPGQEAVTEIVWNTYGSTTRIPPITIWLSHEHLNCRDGKGFWTWIAEEEPNKWRQECVSGAYFPASHMAFVAWPKGTTRISDTAFAHELCHAWTRDLTHRYCRDDGATDDPVTRANLELVKAGF